MDPRTNPYSPGAGARPTELAGRDALIETSEISMDRMLNGLHANSMILTGLRGVGKTVLLVHLAALAKSKGIQVIKMEVPDARSGHLVREMVRALDIVLRRLDRKKRAGDSLRKARTALRSFAAIFQINYEGYTFGVSQAEVADYSGDFEADLPELLGPVLRAAAERDTGLMLFIDEVQYLSATELSALARTCHEAAQQGSPFLFVGAGLPQIAALAGEAKTYAERLFEYPMLAELHEAGARLALTGPAARQGVTITDDALALILKETHRYAYFLQCWGKFAWDEAQSDPITKSDVMGANPAIVAQLDQSFFRVRFDKCTELEQQYLRAMAELGAGPYRTGDIAAALQTSSSKIAPVRRNLIAAGMIYSQRYGETAFTVPLFDTFMKRMIPRLEPYQAKRKRK